MMTWIFVGLITVSVVFAMLNGQISAVSAAAIGEAGKATELMLKLMGSMCLWSGIMNVADKAGLTEKLSKLFSPVTLRLFRGLRVDSPALKAISMNIAANLLGLGNAATPLGITAMTELDKISNHSPEASDNMILFVVLNTASLQLIPTTVIILRQNSGSANPMEIVPAVWLSSAVAVCSGIIMAKILSKIWRKNHV